MQGVCLEFDMCSFAFLFDAVETMLEINAGLASA
jgi:hypothetical protein